MEGSAEVLRIIDGLLKHSATRRDVVRLKESVLKCILDVTKLDCEAQMLRETLMSTKSEEAEVESSGLSLQKEEAHPLAPSWDYDNDEDAHSIKLVIAEDQLLDSELPVDGVEEGTKNRSPSIRIIDTLSRSSKRSVRNTKERYRSRSRSPIQLEGLHNAASTRQTARPSRSSRARRSRSSPPSQFDNPDLPVADFRKHVCSQRVLPIFLSCLNAGISPENARLPDKIDCNGCTRLFTLKLNQFRQEQSGKPLQAGRTKRAATITRV